MEPINVVLDSFAATIMVKLEDTDVIKIWRIAESTTFEGDFSIDFFTL